MNFIVHDAAGNILRKGYCSQADLALQAREGETAIEDKADDTDDRKHRINGRGQRIEFTPEPPPPPTVEQQRARAYPPIADQLDAIWKGPADMEVMRAKVLAVKAAYPKPESEPEAALRIKE
jgi:hypothetical protein